MKSVRALVFFSRDPYQNYGRQAVCTIHNFVDAPVGSTPIACARGAEMRTFGVYVAPSEAVSYGVLTRQRFASKSAFDAAKRLLTESTLSAS